MLENIRWKINLLLVFQPFACFAHCDCLSFKYLPQTLRKLHSLTIGRILFLVFLTGFIIYTAQVLSANTVQKVFRRRRLSITGGSVHRHLLSGDGGDDDDDIGNLGHLSSYFFALSFFLGARFSLFNLFFGLSFENALFYHIWVGRLAIVLAACHGLTFQRGLLPFGSGEFLTGTIIVILGLVLWLFSFNIVRRLIYEIFLKLHWILFIFIAIFSVLHDAGAVGFGLFYTFLDVLMRTYVIVGKSVTVVKMKTLPGKVIRITFEKNSFKYEAGQYVFICIPSIAFTEWHPFSISSAPAADDQMMIHLRVLGDWTRKLYTFVEANKDRKDWSDLTLFAEGPYGNLTVPLEEYSSLVLISGGIGITPMQSIFNQCIYELQQNSKSVKNLLRLHFVWCVRDPTMLDEFGKRHWAAEEVNSSSHGQNQNQTQQQQQEYGDTTIIQRMGSRIPQWFSPDLITVDAGETTIGGCQIITHFYMTRVTDSQEQQRYEAEFPFLKFGRPNIGDILAEAQAANANGSGCSNNCSRTHSGVAVLTCGPSCLIYDVTKHAARHGIDCHTETFDF
jgi:ferredoxin-NADP reductase